MAKKSDDPWAEHFAEEKDTLQSDNTTPSVAKDDPWATHFGKEDDTSSYSEPATLTDRAQALGSGVLSGAASLGTMWADVPFNLINLGRALIGGEFYGMPTEEHQHNKKTGKYSVVASRNKKTGEPIFRPDNEGPDYSKYKPIPEWLRGDKMEANPVGTAVTKVGGVLTNPSRPDDALSRWLYAGGSVVPGALLSGEGIGQQLGNIGKAELPVMAGMAISEGKPFGKDEDANRNFSLVTQFALGFAVPSIVEKAKAVLRAGADPARMREVIKDFEDVTGKVPTLGMATGTDKWKAREQAAIPTQNERFSTLSSQYDEGGAAFSNNLVNSLGGVKSREAAGAELQRGISDFKERTVGATDIDAINAEDYDAGGSIYGQLKNTARKAVPFGTRVDPYGNALPAIWENTTSTARSSERLLGDSLLKSLGEALVEDSRGAPGQPATKEQPVLGNLHPTGVYPGKAPQHPNQAGEWSSELPDGADVSWSASPSEHMYGTREYSPTQDKIGVVDTIPGTPEVPARPSGIMWDAFQRLKTQFGNRAFSGQAQLTGEDLPGRKAAYRGLRLDRDAAIAGTPAEGPQRVADEYYQAIAGEGGTLSKLNTIWRKQSPVAAANTLHGYVRSGNLTMISAIKEALLPHEWRNQVSNYVESMGRVTAGRLGSPEATAGEKFSFSNFLSNYHRIGSGSEADNINTRGAVFGGFEGDTAAAAALDKLARVSAIVKENQPILGQSNSRLVPQESSVTKALRFGSGVSAAGGSPTGMAVLLSTLVGPLKSSITARMTTNPTFVKWLASSTNHTSSSTAANVAGLNVVINKEKDPQAKLDLVKFKEAIAAQFEASK